MKEKTLEKIPWMAKPTKKENEINIHAEVHADTLVVDVSEKKPYVRICLTKKDYAIYVPPGSRRITERFVEECAPGWYQKKIENMGGMVGYRHSWKYRGKIKENIDNKSVNTIKQYTGTNHWLGWMDAINHAESLINSEKNWKTTQARNEKRRNLCDLRMETVPKEPRGFAKWAIEQNTAHRIHFNPLKGRRETEAVCTACGQEFSLKREDIHKYMKCPVCGKNATTKRRNLSKNPQQVEETDLDVMLFQKTEEGFVERHYIVRRTTETRAEKYDLIEYARVFLIHGQTYNYYNKWDPWCGRTFWDDKNLAGMGSINIKFGPLYGKNIRAEMFKGTPYEHSGFDKAAEMQGFDPVRYLLKYEKIPELEYMVKMGLAKLAAEIEVYDVTTFMYGCGGHTGEVKDLLIGKPQWRKLQEINGGKIAYKWMRYEVEKKQNFSPEFVKWYENRLIRPQDLQFIHKTGLLSYEKVQNYLRKQAQVTNEDVRDLIRTWEDYLNMCARAKIDTTKEIFLKPKDIRKAHDDLVKMLGGIEIANRAAEIAKRFPRVDNICKELKEKYAYEGKKFAIITPEKIEDIIIEGRKLGHCLDTTDRYFDRIQKQESYIVFLRRVEDLEKPFYTLEIEPDGTARQKRTTGDRQDESYEECKAFIRRWQKVVKKRMSAEDKKLAKESARLREEEFKELREKKEKVWHGPLAGKLLADVLEADLMVAM